MGPCASLLEKEVRMDGMSHCPQFTEKRGRRRKPGCTGAPKVLCTKFKVHLCFTANSKIVSLIIILSNSIAVDVVVRVKIFFQIYSVIFMCTYATFVKHYIENKLFQTFFQNVYVFY
jgi:hypothetical protein